VIRRAFSAVWRAVADVWDDIRASTDASLLGTARFLGLLYGPIDRSLRIDEALRRALRYRLAPHVGWRHAFGGITYLLFMVLVVTGVLLAIFYRPSAQEAYPSVQHIVSEVPFGWLVRDLHYWSANLIVIAVLAHMARVFFEAAYKPPRETNWLIGLLLLFVVLAFGATGYLLPWDQWAYWTVTEVLRAVSHIPVVGGPLTAIIVGDVIPSGATLSRFFALHVIILPWFALVLLGYHFTLVRRRGVAPPMDAAADRARWRPSGLFQAEDEEPEGIPFFPNHLLRSFIVGVLTLAVAFSLAALFPRALSTPANPDLAPDRLVSTWVPVDVSLALIRLAGPIGFALFTLLGLSLVTLPLIDRSPERSLRHRPLAAALGLTFFIGYLVLFIVGQAIGSVPPSSSLRERGTEERIAPAEVTAAPAATTRVPAAAGAAGSEEVVP
jgi:ubiquinol-cytochrome c reductase cytochrome b subunit